MNLKELKNLLEEVNGQKPYKVSTKAPDDDRVVDEVIYATDEEDARQKTIDRFHGKLEVVNVEEVPEDHETVTEEFTMISQFSDGPDATGTVKFIPGYYGYYFETGQRDFDDKNPQWATIRTVEGIRNWFRNVLFEFGGKDVYIGKHHWNINDFKDDELDESLNEKVEETKNYKRERQANPKSCKEGSFRTKEVNDKGDKVVLCKDKKTDKMKAQSILKKKHESIEGMEEILVDTDYGVKATMLIDNPNEGYKYVIVDQDDKAMAWGDDKQTVLDEYIAYLKKENEYSHCIYDLLMRPENIKNEYVKEQLQKYIKEEEGSLEVSESCKKQISIEEWQKLSKEDQKKYIRNQWNPKKYDLKESNEVEDKPKRRKIDIVNLLDWFVGPDVDISDYHVDGDNLVVEYSEDGETTEKMVISKDRMENELGVTDLKFKNDENGSLDRISFIRITEANEGGKEFLKDAAIQAGYKTIKELASSYPSIDDIVNETGMTANKEILDQAQVIINRLLNEEYFVYKKKKEVAGPFKNKKQAEKWADKNIEDKDALKVVEVKAALIKEECDVCKVKMLNRLDHIVKHCNDTELKQRATSLLDNLGMGVDVKEEVEKLFNEIDSKKSNKEKEDEMKPEEKVTNNAIKGLMEELEELLNEVEGIEPKVELRAEPKRYIVQQIDNEHDDVHQEEFDNIVHAVNAYNTLKNSHLLTELVDTKTDEILATNGGHIDESVNEDIVDDIDVPAVIEEPVEEIEVNTEDEENEEKDPEIEEIADEIMDKIEDAVEERIEGNTEEAEDEIIEPAEDDELFVLEDYKQYLRKGKYEDLQDVKQEIDKAKQQGKSPEEIKAVIDIKSDDEEEKEEAEKYAVDKLTESLLATSKTSKLRNLKK